MLKHFVFNKTAYIGISDEPEPLSVSEGVFTRNTVHTCMFKTYYQSKRYARFNNDL
jgi:hypothetical protein